VQFWLVDFPHEPAQGVFGAWQKNIVDGSEYVFPHSLHLVGNVHIPFQIYDLELPA